MDYPKLDKLDLEILEELTIDGRLSNSQISKRVKSSKETVQYRINKLHKEGIIIKTIPLIDFSRLGYLTYRMQFKFNDINIVEKIIEHFKVDKNVSWIVKLQGNWDLVVLFWIKDTLEFFKISDEINLSFGMYINESSFSIVKHIYYFPKKYFNNESREFLKIGEHSEEKIEISEIERKILEELLKDGSQSLMNIAKTLNYSTTNIVHHFKKLLKEKIILGFIPLIDHKKLGLTHFKITLKLLNSQNKDKLKKMLMETAKIIYITESLGEYDLEFEYLAENINELLNLINVISLKIPLKKHEIIYDNKEIKVNSMVNI